ncbi:hypothetical protein BRARA_F01361 [Brassica rapa]|uniref:DUF4283 domain-containing protein n=1 Tax=Brassica campestris TaxID=3711 RepID=A0A397Z6W3_BRACM|nr:hypothetical protein BRARA_F01361 [Brassica rapa]
MHRRISAAEKGKQICSVEHQAPRTARVRAELPENIELINKCSLTLIGRITNPSVQRMWPLLSFFTELWKSDVRPVGADLGNGMFQFQFEREQDLQNFLDKRPYHYARWMVIVQRWEPTLSKSFPSEIPFWIKVQGVPIHLWSEEILRSIGDDIGKFEKADITPLAMKMRAHVNGLLPLIKSTVIEYSNGEEIIATLVYEKLEKHCSTCLRLDHESYYREIPRKVTGQADVEASSTRNQGIHCEKGSPLLEVPPSLHEEAIQRARGEVRDAMLQYTSSADPTEREARKERMRQAEEHGEVEKAALLVAQAALNAEIDQQNREQINTTPERIPAIQRLGSFPSQERIPVSQRLGPISPVATGLEQESARIDPPSGEDRVPAARRLGPILDSPLGTEASDINPSGKKRRGRPPGSRNTQTKPAATGTSGARKRKVAHPKPSPTRKTLSLARTKAPGGTSRGKSQQGNSVTSSENRPICNMIPATLRKKKMDFQNPSIHGP